MLGAGSIGRRLAIAAAGLLVLAPVAAAKSRGVYINAELSERYYAKLPGGTIRTSVSEVSAYYRTTSHALSSGDGSLQIQPSAVLGSFEAETYPVPGAPKKCRWDASLGGGFQIALLQDGTPFRGELSIQWPDYPGMWNQRLDATSTGNCSPTFQSNPLEGTVKWWLDDTKHFGGAPNRFIYAGVPRDKPIELHRESAEAYTFKMTSDLVYPDGEIYWSAPRASSTRARSRSLTTRPRCPKPFSPPRNRRPTC